MRLCTAFVALCALSVLAAHVAALNGDLPFRTGSCCATTADCESSDLTCNTELLRCVLSSPLPAGVVGTECVKSYDCPTVPGQSAEYECRYGYCEVSTLRQDVAQRGHACAHNEDCLSTDLECRSGVCVTRECLHQFPVPQVGSYGVRITEGTFSTPAPTSPLHPPVGDSIAAVLQTTGGPRPLEVQFDAFRGYRIQHDQFWAMGFYFYVEEIVAPSTFFVPVSAVPDGSLARNIAFLPNLASTVRDQWEWIDMLTVRAWVDGGAATGSECTITDLCTFTELADHLSSLGHVFTIAGPWTFRIRRPDTDPGPGPDEAHADAVSVESRQINPPFIAMAMTGFRINDVQFVFRDEPNTRAPLGACCGTDADCGIETHLTCSLGNCVFATDVISPPGARPPVQGTQCITNEQCGGTLVCLYGQCRSPGNTSLQGQFCQRSYQCASAVLECQDDMCVLTQCVT